MLKYPMSDEDLIEYAKKEKLYGVNPAKIEKSNLPFYQTIRKRGLTDVICVKKKVSIFHIQRFLEENEEARAVASLALVNGYGSETARLLTQEWPDRFPEYEDMLKKLPRLVPTILSSLTPIS